MARTKTGPKPAELQKFSRALNKTRLAAMMGVGGLAFVVVARFFLSPQWLQTALAVFVAGVVSSLLTVGGTYLGHCPHCGAKTPFANAFALRRTKCTHCGKAIQVVKEGGEFYFRRR